MRMTVVGLVACALVGLTSAAMGGGPLERNVPLRGQTAEYKAKYAELMKEVEARQAYATASPQDRHINNLRLEAAEAGRQAAYYFAAANRLGELSDRYRANIEATRPRVYNVQSMGFGNYRITPRY
jgi:hypothetical protein